MAPAARRRPTCSESAVFGGPSANQRDPRVVGMPAQSSRSFTPNGTPASGPSCVTVAHRGVDGAGLGQRHLGVEVHEGVEAFVVLLHRREAGAHELLG